MFSDRGSKGQSIGLAWQGRTLYLAARRVVFEGKGKKKGEFHEQESDER
jgi:hypothetical protein